MSQSKNTDELRLRFTRTIARCRSLIGLAFEVEDYNDLIDSADQSTLDDVARATIVLLHATCEELLRSILFRYLRIHPDEAYSAYKSYYPTNEQVWKSLRRHPDILVSDYIEGIINEVLYKISFNTTDQVNAALDILKITSDIRRSYYPSLARLFERRHKIAHNADLRDLQKDDMEAVDDLEVQEWIDNVESFGYFILGADSARMLTVMNDSQE